METNKELTSIEAAIKLSKVCTHLRILLHRLRQTKMYMNSTPLITFHSAKEDIDRAIADVEYNISHTEQTIYGYIRPYLGANDFVFPNKYSFTSKEMIRGFATLERVLQKSSIGKVLQSVPMAFLLANHTDPFTNVFFNAGDVISFEGHKEFLTTLPSVITQNELDAYLKPNYSCTFNIENLFVKE